MKKVGRNDPCPCGSGKKFKKCCEAKMIGKRFLAQKITQDSSLSGTVSKMNTFFKSAVTQNPSAQPQPKSFKASVGHPKAGDQQSPAEEKNGQ